MKGRYKIILMEGEEGRRGGEGDDDVRALHTISSSSCPKLVDRTTRTYYILLASSTPVSHSTNTLHTNTN